MQTLQKQAACNPQLPWPGDCPGSAETPLHLSCPLRCSLTPTTPACHGCTVCTAATHSQAARTRSRAQPATQLLHPPLPALGSVSRPSHSPSWRALKSRRHSVDRRLFPAGSRAVKGQGQARRGHGRRQGHVCDRRRGADDVRLDDAQGCVRLRTLARCLNSAG